MLRSLGCAPAASIAGRRPRRSIVGEALGWMRCVQMRLKACGSLWLSSSATFAPARPRKVAAAQPAMLAPTIATSYSRSSAERCWALLASSMCSPRFRARYVPRGLRHARCIVRSELYRTNYEKQADQTDDYVLCRPQPPGGARRGYAL